MMVTIKSSDAIDKSMRKKQDEILSQTRSFGITGRLTLKKLKDMEPNRMFIGGFTNIVHPWFNDANNVNKDGRTTLVKYVAIRGDIHDWAIYHSMDANLAGEEGYQYFNGTTHLKSEYERISDHGAKLRDVEIIKALTNCTDEALGWYRY